MADPRIQEYEARHGCRLLGPLGPGPGQDGFVLRSDRLADALHVAEMFRRQTGFVLLDIHPGNVAFGTVAE